MGVPGDCGKEPTCWCRRHRRCEFYLWVGKIPWRRTWQPTLVFLPEEFRGQKSLVGYSPWGRKESDTTEVLSTRAHTPTQTSLRSTFPLVEGWRHLPLNPFPIWGTLPDPGDIFTWNLKYDFGISLVIQWLRLHAPSGEGWGSIPG